VGGVEEREVKMAVPSGFVMPQIDALAGVTVTDLGDELLHAVYWDSDDIALARAGVGLRHRNGVWTFKGRSRRDGDAVVREELELDGDADHLPEAFRERIAPWADVSVVHPIAELRTLRHTFDVSDGSHSAEVVHDRVSVRDGKDERGRFEEVEVEYPTGSEPLADRLVTLLADSGATIDATAKYLRALRLLGLDPPEVTA
jgi:inorganic triphosphatase YgiF